MEGWDITVEVMTRITILKKSTTHSKEPFSRQRRRTIFTGFVKESK